jgi:Cu/Ag efflux protein CusF
MYFISNFCVVLVVTGFITMQQTEASSIQLADAAAAQKETILSHEGTATVKTIDMDKGVVKLAHGPVASLKWPAMTMNFKFENSALMQGIKVDDAVIFTFIKSNGDYVITHIKSSQ